MKNFKTKKCCELKKSFIYKYKIKKQRKNNNILIYLIFKEKKYIKL